MRETIRVVLVDPDDHSRQELQRLLVETRSIWIAETCHEYRSAEQRCLEVAPDLIVISLDHAPEAALDLIQKINRSKPDIPILPASRVHDSALILRSIRNGAREFLDLPVSNANLLAAIDRLVPVRNVAGSGSGPASKSIAITGGTGGAGCTTLAVNLAATLAKMAGHEVVLADFDLLFGVVDILLDFVPNCTLRDIALSLNRLDLTLLKRSLTRLDSGLYVLPHPTNLEEVAQLEPESSRRILMLLKGAFPTVVVDTSKGLQDFDLAALEMADVVLVLTQLDIMSLRNTARLLYYFQQVEGLTDRVKIVANRVGALEGEVRTKKAEETLKMPISFSIPNDSRACHAARAKGVPIDAVAPGNKVHQAIYEIARSLCPAAEIAEAKPRRGRFAALF